MLLPPIDGAAARAELAALVSSLFSQAIKTALPGSPFVVERLRGTEGVNTLGSFEIPVNGGQC